MHWSCRHRSSTQNTWQWIGYFKVNFDSNGLLFLSLIFQISTFNLEKNNSTY